MLTGFLSSAGGLIRYSAIIKHLKGLGEDALITAFEAALKEAGSTCQTHGYLDDPIVGVDLTLFRLIVGCPLCSGGAVLATWESQAVGGDDDAER